MHYTYNENYFPQKGVPLHQNSKVKLKRVMTMLMAGSSTPYYIYKDSSLMIIDSLTKDISLVSAEDCLIIPDVHGRDFWKDAANRFPGNIVF